MGKRSRQAATGLDEEDRAKQAIVRKAEEEERRRKEEADLLKAVANLNAEKRKRQAEQGWVRIP